MEADSLEDASAQPTKNIRIVINMKELWIFFIAVGY